MPSSSIPNDPLVVQVNFSYCGIMSLFESPDVVHYCVYAFITGLLVSQLSSITRTTLTETGFVFFFAVISYACFKATPTLLALTSNCSTPSLPKSTETRNCGMINPYPHTYLIM